MSIHSARFYVSEKNEQCIKDLLVYAILNMSKITHWQMVITQMVIFKTISFIAIKFSIDFFSAHWSIPVMNN